MDQHAALVYAKIDEETHPRGGQPHPSDSTLHDTPATGYFYESPDAMNSILKRAAELSLNNKNGRDR